jgi:hypothetical protein
MLAASLVFMCQFTTYLTHAAYFGACVHAPDVVCVVVALPGGTSLFNIVRY